MNEPTTRVLSFPDPSTARFHLRCWGEFALIDPRRNDCSPRGRKARGLIAHLAAQPGSPVSRERLAGLLWSERGEQQARASLRQTLLELRPYATGASRLIVIERDHAHLNPLAVTSELQRLEALAQDDNLEAFAQALAVKGDRLFGGLDGLDPAFDEWLTLERRVRHDRLLALGTAAAARGLERGACEAVSRLAAELQVLDETNEAVTQIGMKADHARGDHSAVRRRYRRVREAMKQELGVTPSQQTETLFGELTARERTPDPGSEPAASTPANPRPPSGRTPPAVAVLPFANRTGLKADDLFADAMVEDLAAALSLSPWLKVVAPSATAAYRNAAEDLRRIGRDLRVRYLLEGNVRRAGEDLRVTCQLVEAESGNILWTKKFDRPLAGLSALQEDLVTEAAAHLGVQVHRVEMEHALSKPGSFNAWEASLRADAHIGRATSRSIYEAAVSEHRRAVEIDPNNGSAYSDLAAYQGHLLHHLGGDDPELAREIAQNIERARALDPKNPWVLVGIALALAWMRKPLEALPLAERAVAINPNHDPARYALGTILVRLGSSDPAIAEFDAVERLAPNSIWTDLSSRWRSMAHLQAGRLDEALSAADRSLRLLPGPESLIQSALCLAMLDDWSRASDAVRRLRDADPDMSCALMESLVRDFYCGSDSVDAYIATARSIWDEASRETKSA